MTLEIQIELTKFAAFELSFARVLQVSIEIILPIKLNGHFLLIHYFCALINIMDH